MALYFIDRILVRAKDGWRAREIAGRPQGDIRRVREEGPEEIVLDTDADGISAETSETAVAADPSETGIDVTSLEEAGKGERVTVDRKTGRQTNRRKK